MSFFSACPISAGDGKFDHLSPDVDDVVVLELDVVDYVSVVVVTIVDLPGG